jgi:hypothetical protein
MKKRESWKKKVEDNYKEKERCNKDKISKKIMKKRKVMKKIDKIKMRLLI